MLDISIIRREYTVKINATREQTLREVGFKYEESRFLEESQISLTKKEKMLVFPFIRTVGRFDL